MSLIKLFPVATTFMLAARVVCAGELEKDFVTPPAATKPRCYWYWMDGQISKDGITRDLEAMKRVGIGEGYIGVISGESGKPSTNPTRALTDAWWSYIERAARAGNNSLEIAVVNNWNKRLVGDASLPPERRFTSLTLPTIKTNTPLQTSGLLGPVTVQSANFDP